MFAIRIQKIHTKLKLENKGVLPDFSYFRLEIKEPIWGLPSTRINVSLTDLLKNKTPTMAYQKRFKEVVENKYKGWKHIYADGSKIEIGVGAAATTGNRTESASLPKFSSIFTAETHAIPLALNAITATKGKNFSIFTDSRSFLQALQKQIPSNPKVRKLKHTIANLQKLGKTVGLCWIAGHAGIPGNENADKKAKEASRRQEELIPLPYQDLFPYINDAIHQKGNTEWNSSRLRFFDGSNPIKFLKESGIYNRA